MPKFALIGAGKSARDYLKRFDLSLEDFDVYSSTKGEILESKETNNLCKLKTKHYKKIIIAVYNYREILPFLLEQWNESTYWFNSLTSELTVITDRYCENNSQFHSDNDTLCAIYDLRVAPPTFDFLIFLAVAELNRRKKKCKWLKEHKLHPIRSL